MGGIPYQSLGCKACRKRKVKCDLAKPECLRCVKRKVTCPGYDRDRIFIYQQSTRRQEGQSGQLQYLGRARPLTLSVNVRPELVTRSQLISTFLDAFTPPNVGCSSEIDTLPNLVVQISRRPVKSEMLERALGAVSCIYLGRIKEDDALLQTGVQNYEIATRHMARMLSRMVQLDDMVYTTVIFQVLQSLYCPYGLKVWLTHMAGTNALLKHCYQHASTDPLIEVIFHKLQKLMLIHSTIATKWPKEEYQYLQPYTIGTPLDGIFDIFAVLSSLLAATEQANHSDHDTCQTLLQNCLAHREKILRWYSQNQDFMGGPPSFSDPGEVLCPSLPPTDRLFGAPYRFASLDHARLHVLYWTSLTMVQSLIYQARIIVLAHSCPGGTLSPHPAAHQEYLLSEHYAAQICRAVPYCLQPQMKLVGARVIIPAIPHIFKPYMHLRDRERFLWCESVASLLIDLGFHMADHLRQTARKYWSRSEDPNANFIFSLSLRWDISGDEQAPPGLEVGKRLELTDRTVAAETHAEGEIVTDFTDGFDHP